MNPSSPPASLILEEKLKLILNSLLQEMPERAIFFLNRSGRWQKNPLTWRDKAVHELLFRIKQNPETAGQDLVRAILALSERAEYEFINNINLSLSKNQFSLGRLTINQEELQAQFDPEVMSLSLEDEEGRFAWHLFRSILELGAQLALYRAFKLNATIFVPEWDREACQIKHHFQEAVNQWEINLAETLNQDEKSRWSGLERKIEFYLGRYLGALAPFLAAEQRLGVSLGYLLERQSGPNDRDEIYCLIREKLQPPRGVVSEMTPAGFYPALCLLLDPAIDVSSGIQYTAAVALSLFRDRRCCDYLVFCLESFPVFWTKIRENIIYTLGQLKDGQAVWAIARILKEPDNWEAEKGSESLVFPLLEQKEEALWALGKIGWEAATAIPWIVSYADHPSTRLKAYLAWSLGEIGQVQKERTGGIKADILIALLKLLQEKNKEVFEEATSALNKLELPEFIHSLYFYHVGAVSLLGLKPAVRGLNELAASLNYLLKANPRTVVAVTGDSGTGKTYFCQVLASGFSGIEPHEILYLMRDSKSGQKVFNCLLGKDWLRKYIDPAYYEADAASEPAPPFWDHFLEENRQKRLILLDGCRDRHYFQSVVDLFYEQGELDIVVNFRANFSTRRLNLEAREVALESVRLHLSFREEPSLENTYFYQEGKIILYDLDNSIASRLNQEEISELFSGRKLSRWEEFIRLGSFEPEGKIEAEAEEKLVLEEKLLPIKEDAWPEKVTLSIFHQERVLKPRLNDDLQKEPHLLYTVSLPELWPDRIALYAQEQIAGTDETGKIFIYTLNDNRLFFLPLPRRRRNFCLLGRTFFFPESKANLVAISLEREEMSRYTGLKAAVHEVVSMPPDHILTTHADGSIKLWDLEEKRISTLKFGWDSINTLSVDPLSRICFSQKNRVGLADKKNNILLETKLYREEVQLLEFLSRNKMAAFILNKDKNQWGIRVLDFHQKTTQLFLLPGIEAKRRMISLPDGRIIFIGQKKNSGPEAACFLYILSPENEGFSLARINRLPYQLNDVLLLGPKLLTCGLEASGRPCFHVWGSRFFVQAELGKLKIKPY